jgi:F-type H+-transporting ATPase subunit epsilon
MRLRIVTPLSVIVEEDIDSLRAEDESGGFGILAGHTPFLTALAISIVSWRKAKEERFCAVRGGVLTVGHGSAGAALVDIATREAVVGDDLNTLDRQVLTRFRSAVDKERIENVEAVRLQLDVIRRMVSRVRSGANTGEFR